MLQQIITKHFQWLSLPPGGSTQHERDMMTWKLSCRRGTAKRRAAFVIWWGRFLLLALASGSAMAVRLQLPRRKAPNPIDQHVGSRMRMRRHMLAMSQAKLGDALGLTFQQVQKYEKGANRIGASRLEQISHILQVPVAFFFEGALIGSAL